jgi:hypothetical protein
MIRQAMGRAVVSSRTPEDISITREKCIVKIVKLLSLLLPKSLPKDLETAATKSLDKAIALRKVMTEEQAIYRCSFFDRGELVTDSRVDIGDEERTSGKLLLCTFPGLERHIIKDEKRVRLTVVKASGEVEAEIEEPLPENNRIDNSGTNQNTGCNVSGDSSTTGANKLVVYA